MTHQLLGEVAHAEGILDAKSLLDEFTASVLDALQVEEVGADEEGLNILVVDRDHAIVGVVDELLEGHGVHGANADLILF